MISWLSFITAEVEDSIIVFRTWISPESISSTASLMANLTFLVSRSSCSCNANKMAAFDGCFLFRCAIFLRDLISHCSWIWHFVETHTCKLLYNFNKIKSKFSDFWEGAQNYACITLRQPPEAQAATWSPPLMGFKGITNGLINGLK